LEYSIWAIGLSSAFLDRGRLRGLAIGIEVNPEVGPTCQMEWCQPDAGHPVLPITSGAHADPPLFPPKANKSKWMIWRFLLPHAVAGTD